MVNAPTMTSTSFTLDEYLYKVSAYVDIVCALNLSSKNRSNNLKNYLYGGDSGKWTHR